MTVNVDVFDESAPVEPLRFDHPDQPRRPEDDPFHTPPRGWEATAPGAILHTRPVTIAAFGVLRQSFTAWQLLYRTTDLDDRPDTTVVTVLVPEGVAERPERVLGFQCAIDAVSSQCFPSYALRQGARALGAVPQFEIFLIGAALDRGWIVAVPDHEGDARGVRRSARTGVSLARRHQGHTGFRRTRPRPGHAGRALRLLRWWYGHLVGR